MGMGEVVCEIAGCAWVLFCAFLLREYSLGYLGLSGFILSDIVQLSSVPLRRSPTSTCSQGSRLQFENGASRNESFLTIQEDERA